MYIFIFSGEGTLKSLEISYHTHPRYQKLYQTPEFTISCLSEGGPATTVMWWRNGEPVQEDRNHETTQFIVDTSQNSVYNNTLRVYGREGGEYKCTVRTNIPDYFPLLTYLSHNTTTLTVEGICTCLLLGFEVYSFILFQLLKNLQMCSLSGKLTLAFL